MSDTFEFETHREVRARLARESEGFLEFKRLWSAYQEALSVPTFDLSKAERDQNAQDVSDAYNALNRLAQED